MADDKIKISWDELKTAKVEKQVRQQAAMSRNRKYAKMTDGDFPDGEKATAAKPSIWYNSIFCLAVFGLLGGLLAWTGAVMLHLRADPRLAATQTIAYIQQIRSTVRSSPDGEGISSEEAKAAISSITRTNGSNPYVAIFLDDSLTSDQKQQKQQEQARNDAWKNLLTNIIGYGICGMLISICLSLAEPMVDRNLAAAVMNGSVGALLGLLGGLAASIVMDRVYQAVIGGAQGYIGNVAYRQDLARAASWAVLGCFISVAPGLVARSPRRLLIGVIGGALGGAVGGILFDPITRHVGNPEVGKLIALLSIGLVAGIATGVIERAARTGWLKVTSGVIAGKQFIIYRNPTYIGSAPDCQIYLFKDPKVGRRHAAVHVLKGRMEIEDLPLGEKTLVNGEPITRHRLRDGDEIAIGSTTFKFQEKAANN
jgi:hypothetical protein